MAKNDQDHDLLTVAEVAAYLRVAERTVYDWAQKGILPGAKLGSSWRFRRPQLEAWIERRFSSSDTEQIELRQVLSADRVLFLKAANKQEALDTLVDCLAKTDAVKDGAALRQGIYKREEMMSTGIGLGVGLPHVRLESVTGPVMAVGRCIEPLPDYEALDDVPVSIIFMIAAGKNQHAFHIKLLAAISKRMKNQQLRDLLGATDSPADFYELLVRET